MGKSSSGKDTIFRALKRDENLNLKPIITYTTRPKRINETDGGEYYFINETIIDAYRNKGKVIEERIYNTVNGKWHYCTIDDGQINLDAHDYILIVTLESYENLKKYFGEEIIIPIYIKVEDGDRLLRAIAREKRQVNPNYNELCRRFLADNADFSDEKLKLSNINNIYENNNLEACIDEVKKYIITHKYM